MTTQPRIEPSQTDERLLEALQAGDVPAFDELYRRYSKRLLHYFHRLLGDAEQAQDFLQELFLKVITKPQRFEGRQRFSAWLYTVAHNMCKNEYRRLQVRRNLTRAVEVDEVLPEAAHEFAPEAEALRAEVSDKVWQALEACEAVQRSTFLLRFQQELSIKEISVILSCSEGTTKSRLFYTLKKLAKSLTEFDPRQS